MIGIRYEVKEYSFVYLKSVRFGKISLGADDPFGRIQEFVRSCAGYVFPVLYNKYTVCFGILNVM